MYPVCLEFPFHVHIHCNANPLRNSTFMSSLVYQATLPCLFLCDNSAHVSLVEKHFSRQQSVVGSNPT